MKFIDLQFMPNGFKITREDQMEMSFPYSKIDYSVADPKSNRLRLEIKKHGSFTCDYGTYADAEADNNRLFNKGKVH